MKTKFMFLLYLVVQITAMFFRPLENLNTNRIFGYSSAYCSKFNFIFLGLFYIGYEFVYVYFIEDKKIFLEMFRVPFSFFIYIFFFFFYSFLFSGLIFGYKISLFFVLSFLFLVILYCVHFFFIFFFVLLLIPLRTFFLCICFVLFTVLRFLGFFNNFSFEDFFNGCIFFFMAFCICLYGLYLFIFFTFFFLREFISFIFFIGSEGLAFEDINFMQITIFDADDILLLNSESQFEILSKLYIYFFYSGKGVMNLTLYFPANRYDLEIQVKALEQLALNVGKSPGIPAYNSYKMSSLFRTSIFNLNTEDIKYLLYYDKESLIRAFKTHGKMILKLRSLYLSQFSVEELIRKNVSFTIDRNFSKNFTIHSSFFIDEYLSKFAFVKGQKHDEQRDFLIREIDKFYSYSYSSSKQFFGSNYVSWLKRVLDLSFFDHENYVKKHSWLRSLFDIYDINFDDDRRVLTFFYSVLNKHCEYLPWNCAKPFHHLNSEETKQLLFDIERGHFCYFQDIENFQHHLHSKLFKLLRDFGAGFSEAHRGEVIDFLIGFSTINSRHYYDKVTISADELYNFKDFLTANNINYRNIGDDNQLISYLKDRYIANLTKEEQLKSFNRFISRLFDDYKRYFFIKLYPFGSQEVDYKFNIFREYLYYKRIFGGLAPGGVPKVHFGCLKQLSLIMKENIICGGHWEPEKDELFIEATVWFNDRSNPTIKHYDITSPKFTLESSLLPANGSLMWAGRPSIEIGFDPVALEVVKLFRMADPSLVGAKLCNSSLINLLGPEKALKIFMGLAKPEMQAAINSYQFKSRSFADLAYLYNSGNFSEARLEALKAFQRVPLYKRAIDSLREDIFLRY